MFGGKWKISYYMFWRYSLFFSVIFLKFVQEKLLNGIDRLRSSWGRHTQMPGHRRWAKSCKPWKRHHISTNIKCNLQFCWRHKYMARNLFYVLQNRLLRTCTFFHVARCTKDLPAANYFIANCGLSLNTPYRLLSFPAKFSSMIKDWWSLVNRDYYLWMVLIYYYEN